MVDIKVSRAGGNPEDIFNQLVNPIILTAKSLLFFHQRSKHTISISHAHELLRITIFFNHPFIEYGLTKNINLNNL